MTKQVFSNVLPVMKGFQSVIVLQYTSDFWTLYGLNSNELAVTFNDTLDDSTPLYVASTVGGQVVRDDVNKKLTITIPAATTAAWTTDYIQFDVMRYSGATKYIIPGLWKWPVSKRVGLNVPS